MKGLGDRLKSLRKQRRLTLVEVARKTGIDQATLSRMENGKMTGTLKSHMKLAEMFALRLPDLYNSVVNKLDEAKEKAVRQKLEAFSHSSGAVAQLLTTGILQKKMMPILLKLKPKSRTEIEEFPAGTERFIYVTKGHVRVTIGSDKTSLKIGEGLYFNGTTPHYFVNGLKSESACLSVITPSSL